MAELRAPGPTAAPPPGDRLVLAAALARGVAALTHTAQARRPGPSSWGGAFERRARCRERLGTGGETSYHEKPPAAVGS